MLVRVVVAVVDVVGVVVVVAVVVVAVELLWGLGRVWVVVADFSLPVPLAV